MSNKKNITRREALKKMSAVAAGIGLGIVGINAADVPGLPDKKEKRRKMTEADAIILGSSTYSADVSSTLKAVIERASVVSDTNPGMFRHKVGGAVAVARRSDERRRRRCQHEEPRTEYCVAVECHTRQQV